MLLKDVVKEVIANNKIVIFSSHQMNYIEEFCDSIAILNGGQIAICGDLYDIKRNYPRNKLVVRSVDSDKIQAECGLACEKGEAQGEIIIMLPDAADKKAIMQKLTEKYDIDEIKIFEPSLNDIFVEHAGKQI